MRLTSENVGCVEFSQKLGSAKPSKKRKPSMKDEVNLPKAARTSAVHSSPFT